MRVVFGWHLDGETFPETANGQSHALADIVAGPATLLDILETQLGLGGPAVGVTERIAAYQERLRRLDAEDRFYHRSFATDPWATTREILSWRDGLVAAGWDGRPVPEGGDRLACLADAEAITAPQLPVGMADRLRAVLAALADAPKLDLDAVDMTDSPEALPPVWRRLMDLLRGAGVTVTALPRPQAGSGYNDLNRVQRVLTGQPVEPLAGDGSLVLLEADDSWQAADAVAGWLAAGDNQQLVLVQGEDGTLLDQACHAHGLPRPGAENVSRWRSALQVLPLAFEARWAPINPQRLLELLTLPQGPIPPSVAARFADALREEPGLGGPRWRQAWEDALEHRRQTLATRPNVTDIEAKLVQDAETWRGWLEGPCHDSAEGMPVTEALAICRRIQHWARTRGGLSGDTLLLAAARQAAACERALQMAGADRISRVQLGRVLDEVVAEGVAAGWAGAEAAPWTVVSHPGRVWGQAAAVVWWGFTGPGISARPPAWRSQELSALATAGVMFEDAAAIVGHEALTWRRAVLLAGDRLLLVQPRSRGGDATVSHPLWHELLGLLGGERALAPLKADAAAFLADPAPILAGRSLRRVVAPPSSPPQPKPVWQVAPGLIQARDRDSATSLSQLFGCPFAWVLSYGAHLQGGASISVIDNSRLIGTLAHAVIEHLFAERTVWPADQAQIRARALFDHLLPQRAATLLLPGRLLERNDACDRVARAVGTLCGMMADAGLRFEGAERQFAGTLNGRDFAGTVDLLLQDSSGQRVIFDMKWTGWPKYKRLELEEGRAVQLAAYAAIVPGCRPDGAGYFMLRDADLFFAAPQPFPSHHVSGPSSLAEVWRRCGESHRLRMDALMQGMIQVPDEDWTKQQGALALEPPCRVCGFGTLCGKTGV